MSISLINCVFLAGCFNSPKMIKYVLVYNKCIRATKVTVVKNVDIVVVANIIP